MKVILAAAFIIPQLKVKLNYFPIISFSSNKAKQKMIYNILNFHPSIDVSESIFCKGGRDYPSRRNRDLPVR